MKNEPSSGPPGRRFGLTRRGRLVLTVTAFVVAAVAAVAAVAVLVPLLLNGAQEEKKLLLVPEGWRATQVYAAIDKALDEPPGTTAKAVGTARLKLPADARGNPEGYLFPATYPVDSTSTPQSLLSYMVNTAHQRFGADRMSSGAERSGLTAYQTVSIASIVQAEADTPEDMGKVARVIYNRLAQGMPLQMDSTLNYALNRSTLDTTAADTRIDSPYNSYQRRGLPPTPIDNPGEQAMRAAISPPPGNWLYFVTVAPGDTRFTAGYEEHRRNVAEFNARRRSASSSG
ncbi:endolytic transglycosylase MltG [Streptomyces sp. NBC_01481]|uniref:endolytic transglycosylase MltG n=1 Tax=Streptomyces sp. NBC_01481 TaxID=2975869 RepID=UPI00224CE189|nr:endolytic transglycosylase MltG [Streptomyces sp. NBC_01481]MCX4587386.1 endolytic transglycosylase MltG [Streptomyces sp. NBC_01481]